MPWSFEKHHRRLSGHGEAATRFPEFGLGEAAYEAALAVPESGESLRDLADRVTAKFDWIAGDDGTVLVVTHGGPLHMLLGYAKGMELPEALGGHHQANCGVDEFVAADGEVRVVRENETPRA